MKVLALACVAALVAGCASIASDAELTARTVFSANYAAADALAESARGQLDNERPILVATLVDIDDLERSSTLGRFLSESISTRFTQNRYRMVEMKLQGAVYMKTHEGELLLSRKIQEIASAHQAQTVIVGTYSRANTLVFVNLKVVKPESNFVIAARDYALPMTSDVCTMIYRDARACVERRWY